MKANVKYREVGSDHIGTTSYIGENITRQFIIDWFGLNDDDVEWFDIEITNN